MAEQRAIDARRAASLVERLFSASIVPALTDYIRIPNQSPAFDADWERAGHMQRAMDLIVAWCRAQAPAGTRLEVVKLPGRTPLLFIEVPGQIDEPHRSRRRGVPVPGLRSWRQLRVREACWPGAGNGGAGAWGLDNAGTGPCRAVLLPLAG